MHHWRIPLKVVSGLLIVLGLLISVAAVVSAIWSGQPTASPFDQVETPDLSSKGFDPMIIPEGVLVEPRGAPTLPLHTSDLKGELPTTWPGVTPAAPPIAWRDPAVREGFSPTATPEPIWIPDRLVIPAIRLDARVIPATLKDIEFQGKPYQQWVAPNSAAAGLLTTSATLGVAGNTVLIGHHNEYGEVFGHLVDLKVGDLIRIYSGVKEFTYIISLKMILPERYQPLEVRLKNAQWIAPSLDVRLTLVTCWPYDNNTHRLIIVATPVNLGARATKIMK